MENSTTSFDFMTTFTTPMFAKHNTSAANINTSTSASWSTTTPPLSSTSDPLQPDPYFRLALYVLMGMVALVGIVGNVCVCFIVIRGKKMYTIANLFLMNLALADIFVLSICYPLSIIRNEMDWPFGEVLCKILPSLSDCFYGVSMGCITAIAVYRYRMILHALTTHMSFGHAKLTLIVIWVLALCVISVPLCWILKMETYVIPIPEPKTSVPREMLNNSYYSSLNNTLTVTANFLIKGNSSRQTLPYLANPDGYSQDSTNASKAQKYFVIRKCVSRWPSQKFRKIYQIVQISWYVLPLSVILFTYLRIRTYLKKTLRYEWTKTGDNSPPQSGLTNRVIGIKRALTLLAPVVVTFAVLMFPWNMFRFLSLIMDLTKIKYLSMYLEVAAAMMVANSCSNPFIYYIMSKDFRDEFRRQFRLFTRCYKFRRENNFQGRYSLRSASSFKTREETIAADETKNTTGDGFNRMGNNNSNMFGSSWERYAVREVESQFATKPQKQLATFNDDLKVEDESAKLLEPVSDPDRETII